MESRTEILLHSVIEQHNIQIHFQPIVHLQTRQIYGYEGLIRGPVNTVLHSPTRLFEAATRAGRLAELDLMCRRSVINRFAQLGLPGRLFINVDPYSLVHEHFQEGLTLDFIEHAGLNPSQLIIELTETHPVEDINLMQQAMHHYREMGFRVALDDLGAGYSGSNSGLNSGRILLKLTATLFRVWIRTGQNNSLSPPFSRRRPPWAAG